jgi:glycosyltransferase involved in cell wall biosynthesis
MEAKRHVLIIVQNTPIERDKRVQREIIALRDAGYNVSLICQSSTDHDRHLSLGGVQIYRYRLKVSGANVFSYFVEYICSFAKISALCLRIYLKHTYNIIHVCNPPDIFFPLGIIIKMLGGSFVFDQHDPTPEIYLSRFKKTIKLIYVLLKMLELFTLKTANAIFVTNESAKGKALLRTGGNNNHIYVVRNGPFITFSEPGEVNHKLKAGHKFLVCCVGAIAPQDGGDYLLKVASHLIVQCKRRDICFAIIGGGSMLQELKNAAAQMGMDQHIIFTGWIHEERTLRSYLATADVCVSPEPSSSCNDIMTFIKVLDYMCAAKPIVAFDLKETRYSADAAALYAKPNDIVDFAEKISYLLSNPTLRSKMGSYGKERVESVLAWERSKATMLKAFEKMCEHK